MNKDYQKEDYQKGKLEDKINLARERNKSINENYIELKKLLKNKLKNVEFEEISPLLKEIRKLNNEQNKDNEFFYEASKKLKEKSTIDGLTNILNRHGFEEYVSNIIGKYKRRKDEQREELPNEYILAYFDLDDLKVINDKKGHNEGDKYIMAFVDSMKKYFREEDAFGRLGGDEFAALIKNGINDEKFNERLDTIKNEIKRNTDYDVSFSFIRINFNEINSLKEFKECIREADTLMYKQKRQKKSNS